MLVIRKVNSQKIEPKIIAEAVQYLRRNDLVIYPTDTSYGIGALFSNQDALAKLSRLKGRPEDKKYSVVIPDIEFTLEHLKVNVKQKKILRRYLPGKYTFILARKNSPGTLGIRLIESPLVQVIASRLDEPITATSANVSNEPDAYSIDDLQKGILRRADLINGNILVLDGGPLERGQRSTIVDLTQTPPKILRQGSGQFETNEVNFSLRSK